MTTINDQPQHLLFRYQKNTKCFHNLYKDHGGDEVKIRLALSEYGLPSHLKPYKDNPRLPGDGYRVPTAEDSCNQPHEHWNGVTWERAMTWKSTFSRWIGSDYRLPASVLPPDWEEMTREDAAGETVENQQPAATETPKSAEFLQHPEIFEAHGLEWYRYNGSNQCPCEKRLNVRVLCSKSEPPATRPSRADTFAWGAKEEHKLPWGIIIGWRPADAPAKLPRPDENDSETSVLTRQRDEAREAHGIAMLKLTKATKRVAELEIQLKQCEEVATHSSTNFTEVEAELEEATKRIADLEAQLAASTSTLRPIAEMPAEVPEGCVRTYYRKGHGTIVLASPATAEYFGDARMPEGLFPAPPDPDEAIRREFEAWWSAQSARAGKHKAESYEAYKAGRCAHPQGAAA